MSHRIASFSVSFCSTYTSSEGLIQIIWMIERRYMVSRLRRVRPPQHLRYLRRKMKNVWTPILRTLIHGMNVIAFTSYQRRHLVSLLDFKLRHAIYLFCQLSLIILMLEQATITSIPIFFYFFFLLWLSLLLMIANNLMHEDSSIVRWSSCASR